MSWLQWPCIMATEPDAPPAKRWVKRASLVLCILICLATVFIKQHSVLDG